MARMKGGVHVLMAGRQDVSAAGKICDVDQQAMVFTIAAVCERSLRQSQCVRTLEVKVSV